MPDELTVNADSDRMLAKSVLVRQIRGHPKPVKRPYPQTIAPIGKLMPETTFAPANIADRRVRAALAALDNMRKDESRIDL